MTETNDPNFSRPVVAGPDQWKAELRDSRPGMDLVVANVFLPQQECGRLLAGLLSLPRRVLAW